jgi:hypothetical protein
MMNETQMAALRDAEALVEISNRSHEPSASDILRPAQTDLAEIQQIQIDEKRAVIDADATLPAMQTRALTAVERGQAHFGGVEEARATLKSDVFDERSPQMAADFEKFLEGQTDAVVLDLDQMAARYAPPGPATTITAVDSMRLHTALLLARDSVPIEVRRMALDAEARGDLPLAEGLRTYVTSVRQYKNSWRGPAAQRIADEVLAILDRATFSPDRAAGEHAREVTRSYALAWKNLVQILRQNGGRLDPIHRRSGELVPLIPLER